MAGRFPLYADADLNGRVVKALRSAGWDILRGIEAYPGRTSDSVHFTRAAEEGRVLVSNDVGMKAIAEAWFVDGRPFAGLVWWWPQSHYAVMGPGDFVAAFDDMAAQDNPFSGYPIVYIKPRR